jgi:hypothetical protein
MAKVHRANVTDRDGIKLLLEPAKIGFLKASLAPVAGRLSTPARRTGAQAGFGRPWDGRQRSLDTPRRWLPKR